MRMRSVRLAYVIPPLLAVVLAFLGMLRLSDSGVVGVSSVVTAAAGTGTTSNGRIAVSLEDVARRHHATIVRTVADRSAPTTRRTALVTAAPGTDGAGWLRDGYPDFSRTVRTAVRPMAALDRYDPTGSYEVIGDHGAERVTAAALRGAGFTTSSETVPVLDRIGVTGGVQGTSQLTGTLVLGCVALCFVGTIGAPRRTAVRRLHGRSAGAIVCAELSEVRATLTVVLVGVPVVGLLLWFHNGLTSWETFAMSAAVFTTALLVPVVAAHVVGTLIAVRRPIAATLRGARLPGALVLVAHAARLPAVLLLVAAVFDVTAAVAAARSDSGDRELQAAGDAVQLWVTPDPRPGSETQGYWDRIGDFVGGALDRHDALLTAAVEVVTGTGPGSVPGLFVDAEYLRHQDLRAENGDRITVTDDRITVWTPPGSDLDRRAVIRALVGWELRGAPDEQRRHIGGGALRSTGAYTYAGDSSAASWSTDAVVVVVPDASGVFTPDQLGAWLSTGDVVFTSEAVADHAIEAAGLGDEFSAVVSVGQAVAERQRQAATAVGIGVLAVISGLTVAVVLAVISTAAHHRRHGRRLFAGIAAGRPPARVNGDLLLVEGLLLSAGGIAVVHRWWQTRPDGSGAVSALDPAARAAGVSGVSAVAALVVLTAVAVAVVAVSTRAVVRSRGSGS
ncbi:hypothetical protein DEJ25_01775 [Curtobacterium sp. MCPF17_011]|uniref:hypothetical protein n=1 Tax=Curtobacterium sp. MCPF17_011 TaxID=2175652 RepID=UPI000DA748AB|nr:hypothetical protein [Curtobacterium sp. MCPF17_011]PZF15481.1 hypothetical protein DEJ25_01775 [Curtobacterium sp. MCPF17_011]